MEKQCLKNIKNYFVKAKRLFNFAAENQINWNNHEDEAIFSGFYHDAVSTGGVLLERFCDTFAGWQHRRANHQEGCLL